MAWLKEREREWHVLESSVGDMSEKGGKGVLF